MNSDDLKMLKGIEFLLEKGSFTLKRREAPALIAVDMWVKGKIAQGVMNKTPKKKKKRGLSK